MDYAKINRFQTYQQQKQSLINKNYREIYAHELAHKETAGGLAGSIVIENNSDGIPVSGHVSIKMPSLNNENPNETIKNANIVMKAALAPNEPSSQDYKVYNTAKKIKSKAENVQNKKIDYYA